MSTPARMATAVPSLTTQTDSTLSSPASSPDKARLGEQLARAKLISDDDLQAAFRNNPKRLRLGELLLELGMLTEEQLLPFLERQLGCPAVRLREGLIDPAIVHVVPRRVADRLGVVPLFLVHGELTVAIDDPLDLVRIDELRRVTGKRVRTVFAFRASIERMAQRCYQDDFQVDTVTADLDESAVELQLDHDDFDLASVERLVEGSPVINLVNYVVLQAIQKGASDIHIEPSRKYSKVRFRIDGQLQEVLRPRRDIHPALISRIKVMAKMDIAEHHAPQDGRCQVTVENKNIDLRISTLPTVEGEKVVIRVLDGGRLTFDLEKLGLLPEQLGLTKDLLSRPYGLILVTGPTGSGKTTTLYSALELIKSVHRNIVTVEDPVEYQIDLVNQVQVDVARGLSFADSLRSILRQDPDVIMVGEIRDAETAQVAIQAALTGHLVISTLHTNDSAGAITRLADMRVEDYKIAAALQGVVAQRLVRTVCQKCKVPYYPSADMLQLVGYQGDARRRFLRGEGCRECFDTGYRGRMGIYEVLEVGPEVRRLIVNGTDTDQIRAHFRNNGGVSLVHGGLTLAERELTTIDEVARVAHLE